MLFIVGNDGIQLGQEEEDITNASHGLVEEVNRSDEPVTLTAKADISKVAKSAHFARSKELLRLDQRPARKE